MLCGYGELQYLYLQFVDIRILFLPKGLRGLKNVLSIVQIFRACRLKVNSTNVI